MIYRLSITLQDSQPAVRRQLNVPEECDFVLLHDVIQLAMGWENYHPFMFFVGPRRLTEAEAAEDLAAENGEAITLGSLGLNVGDSFLYQYDFVDDWGHLIVVEAVETPEAGKFYPFCVSAENACPPEDGGGIHTYNSIGAATLAPSITYINQQIREILPDPTHS